MQRSLIGPLLFGLAGVAILLALGVWQLQRLEWKSGVLDRIEARLSAEPTGLPDDPQEFGDEYRRVVLAGSFLEGEAHIYTSAPGSGVGYRIVAPFETADGRRVLVDRGFVPISDKDAVRSPGGAEIEGALLWPDEGAAGEMEPDLAKNIWIARDVEALARELATEPILVVASAERPPGPARPLPVSVNIPNNHLEYAITWFGLATVWAGMTVYLVWRIKRRSV